MTEINTTEKQNDHDISLRETIDRIEICESIMNNRSEKGIIDEYIEGAAQQIACELTNLNQV